MRDPTRSTAGGVAPWLLAAALVALAFPAAARLDNKGTEFVLGFQTNVNSPVPFLFITGEAATSGTVSIPGLSFVQAFNVTPGAITTVQLPVGAFVTGSDVVTQQGILVTADDEVVVYGLNQAPFTTDAYLGLPTDILGTEHRVISYASTSHFLVVGAVDDTTVTITPSAAAGSHPAGVAYDVALNRLDTYQLNGTDLSGTLITSDQPVAVFAGNPCVNVPTSVSFCDHLVEQIPPTSTWGVGFLTVPLATRTAGDVFRIIARDDGTDVSIDGSSLTTLNAGQFVETDLASGTYHSITTTGPALVMQYSKGSNADGVQSDPFMMMIPPTEQFLDGYTVTTPAAAPVSFTNFVNVVAPTADAGSCTIDGGAYSAAFVPIGATGFSAVQEPVAIGTHNLACPVPFGAYAYGFASDDSYGYPAGLALEAIAVEACVLSPETDFNPPGSDHTVDAKLTVNVLDPLLGVQVAFTVAGVNASAAGTCSPNADCTTDANGEVSFTYTGAGGIGIDEISGSFFNSDEELVGCQPTPSVEKVWDDDCNENGVPDTCDASCDGFGGACSAYEACGEVEVPACGFTEPIVHPPTPTPVPGDWGEGIVGWKEDDESTTVVVAARELGLLTYNYDELESPDPNPISQFAPPGCNFEDLDVLDDRWIAAAAGNCGTYLLDYLDRANPVERGHFDSTYAKDVSIAESGGTTHLFVADYFDGFWGLETDTSAVGTLPFSSQRVPVGGYSVAVHYEGGGGSQVVWVAHTNGIDAIDPDQGAVVGSCTTTPRIPQDVVSRDGVVYLPLWVDGIMTIDVPDPAQLSGTCASHAIHDQTDTCQAFYKVALNGDGNELYVTEGQYGVAVFGVDGGFLDERDYSQVLLDGQHECTTEGPGDPVLDGVPFAWGIHERDGVVGVAYGLLDGPTGGYQLIEPPPPPVGGGEDEVPLGQMTQVLLAITGGQRVSCGLIGIEPFLLLGALKLVQRARRRAR